MKRAWPIVMLVAVMIAVGLSDARPALAAPVFPRASHVTIVLAPYLTFDDVTATSTPNLWRMAQSGAVGAINVRSRMRESGEPASPIEGALSLSAGAWTQPDFSAMAAYDATEAVATSVTAQTVYRRVFGTGMGSSRIAFLGLPGTQQINDVRETSAIVGSLGQAVRDANGLTVAVGNSDSGTDSGQPRLLRPAAVAAADLRGLVSSGDVSADLLKPSPKAPYGVSTDLSRFESVYARADSYTKGHDGPSLVVLDAGDLTRARRFASKATPDAQAAQWAASLKTLDAVAGMAEKRRGADGVVIVVSQSLYALPGGLPAGLGPVIVSGEGWSGYLTSSSTHRTGVVAASDVTAAVLEALGITRPVAVLGDPLTPVSGPAGAEQRLSHLARLSAAAVSIDAPKATILNLFIGLVVLVLVASILAIGQTGPWSPDTLRRSVRVIQGGLLLVVSVPLASWLMFLPTPLPATPLIAVVSLLGTLTVVWVLALLAWRRLAFRMPVAVLALGLAGLMIVDQLVGAPLSYVGFISYSPLLAARFYGMGNEAAAILFGASLVGAALVLDQWPASHLTQLARRFGMVVLGVVVVAVAATPFLGANVGAAVWALAGFATAWMLMNGRRFGVRSVAVVIVLVLATLAVFSAVDLLGGGAQTHLGRALTSAEQGGSSQLWTIVVRKAETNLRVLTSTNWSGILMAGLALLGFVFFRRDSDYPALRAENPNFTAAVVATLVAGAIALVTEDSGVVIPSLIMLYTSTGLAWLMLARLDRPDSKETT